MSTNIPFSTSYTQGYATAVARGDVPRAFPFAGYGEITTVGAVTDQIIWPDGAYTLPPAGGIQLSIVSTSAQDGVGGTGIRSVELHYLDAALTPMTETVILNGLTPVLTVATNMRFITCMHMITYGSGKKAAGTISATNTAITYSLIAVGAVRCTSAVRMVPAGKRLFVNGLSGGSSSPNAPASAIIRICSTYFDGHDYSSDSVFIPLASAVAQDGAVTLTLPTPMVFPAGAAVGMQVTVDKAAVVVGSWFGWVEDA